MVNVRFSGTRVRTDANGTTVQSVQSGSATGLGDITVNTRYQATGSALRGVSVGGDLRMPTGRKEDLLGSGATSVRLLAIGSYEEGRLAVSANAGVGYGGASREQFWAMATTFAAFPRVTVVGELLGRRMSALSYVQDVYQPHPLTPGVETMRWVTAETGAATTLLVAGAKWNVVGPWLLNANVLIRVTDAGLRARVTPGIALGYDFQR